MDSVRLGRVLGIGTRLAARTLVSAMDAATAEKPHTGNKPACATGPEAPVGKSPNRVAQTAAQPVAKARVAAGGFKQGSRKFGEAVYRPIARLSGVLWLEVTGVFFGLFAFLAGAGAWKQRSALMHMSSVPEARNHLLLLVGVSILFAYFCVSSFVKANRRGRRK